MRISRRIAFLILAGAQIVFPLALVGWNELDLQRGKEIRLLVRPVDPNDFFRGEYVALSYGISSVSVIGAQPGDIVYVPLFNQGDVWNGSFATDEPPFGGTFIRGRLTTSFPRIQYGIETFFVPEGQARQYERAMASQRLVSVNGDGKARVRRLEIR